MWDGLFALGFREYMGPLRAHIHPPVVGGKRGYYMSHPGRLQEACRQGPCHGLAWFLHEQGACRRVGMPLAPTRCSVGGEAPILVMVV